MFTLEPPSVQSGRAAPRSWRAAAALWLALHTCAAQANLVTNGDFEAGTFNGWSLFTTAHGTLGPLGALPQVLGFDTTGAGISRAAAFSVGELTPIGSQDGGGIYQSFSASSAWLSISVDIAANLAGAEQNAEGGVFSLLLDGQEIDRFRVGQIFDQTVRHTLIASGEFGAGTHELRIQITRPATQANGLIQYIDNVEVTDVMQVPEPGSFTLAGIALTWLAAHRNLKRRKA